MSKNNQKIKNRNYVVKKMISRKQKSGYHLDIKKETNKFLARSKIDYENDESSEELIDYEDEF